MSNSAFRNSESHIFYSHVLWSFNYSFSRIRGYRSYQQGINDGSLAPPLPPLAAPDAPPLPPLAAPLAAPETNFFLKKI